MKPKTAESQSAQRKKWITKYTQVLSSYGLSAGSILKEADKNKDGKLELAELDKIIRLYIKEADLNYSDIKCLIDSLDTNNDGTVTIAEYKEIMLEYGVKPADLEPAPKSADYNNIVNEVKSAAQSKGTTLKTILSTFTLDANGEINIASSLRYLKKGTGLDNAKSLELLKAIACSDDPKVILAEEIFSFYEKYLSDDPNTDLELRFILAQKEAHSAYNVFELLSKDLSKNTSVANAPIEMAMIMRTDFNILESSSDHLLERIKEFRKDKKIMTLMDIFNTLDLLLVLEDFGIDVQKGLTIPEDISSKICHTIGEGPGDFDKAMAGISKQNSVNISATGTDQVITPNDLRMILSDKAKLLTAFEALVLFEGIHKACKSVSNSISGFELYDYLKKTYKDIHNISKSFDKSDLTPKSKVPSIPLKAVPTIEAKTKEFIPSIFRK
jgi:hypothetical protein